MLAGELVRLRTPLPTICIDWSRSTQPSLGVAGHNGPDSKSEFRFILRGSEFYKARASAAPLAFQRRGPQLRNDPVAHLNAEYQTELARVSSQDVGAPLTRVSATFWRVDERHESKWESDSRNVKYGIF
jgi:hypothetical protein